MDYRDYFERFGAHRRFATLTEYGRVVEADVEYPLVRLDVPGPRCCLVTTGFHGEEPAGPLTVLEHAEELVDHARALGVGLRIYPCINPSGFEAGTRYNRSGERPNNDFLRYEIAPGELVDELRDGATFLRWELYRGGPKETRALRADLEQLPRPAAALDVHQDDYIREPLSYAYVFGPRAPYRALMDAIAPDRIVARRRRVDEGLVTDDDGLLEFTDGSVTDWFHRLGTPHCATLETSTATPSPLATTINKRWIIGFLDLAAETAR